MYKRILVPLDGSKVAEQILPHVRTIAKGTGARAVLVRAFRTRIRLLHEGQVWSINK